jgi:hypothetical protein
MRTMPLRAALLCCSCCRRFHKKSWRHGSRVAVLTVCCRCYTKRAQSCRATPRSTRFSSYLAYGSIRQHTAAYISIRQHTLACVSIRQHTAAYDSIRQHASAYVSMRQHTSAYVSIRQHASAYVSIRQHASAYVSIRQHTSRLITHARFCKV